MSHWSITRGDGPLVATAIHDGHALRPEVAALMALAADERRREEDPYTARWTAVAGTQVVVHTSRFEMDLNRPPEKAVYIEPEDAWGLHVWNTRPGAELVDHSLAQYDAFYADIGQLFTELARNHNHFVVLDLHSYNHRRSGPAGPEADPVQNPEVNIGTGSLDRTYWAPVVDGFMADLRGFDYLGRRLDVRENVKFTGGHFSRWTHRHFPKSACVLAVEFKKFFMDEWSGEPDELQIETIGLALRSTVTGILAAIEQL